MKLHKQTQTIRIQTQRGEELEHSTPLFLTSSFVFNSAEEMAQAFNDENDLNIYSRYSNPNIQEFVTKMCVLENAENGVATSTGMAAVYASFIALLKSGDHIICCSSVFGSTFTILTKYLPKLNIQCTFFNVSDLNELENKIQPNTKMIYLETPTNPGLEIIDLEFVGKISKKHNLIFSVDNCFATPILQNPIDFGADLVIHSATKWIDGQGRVLGGIIVGNKVLINEIYLFCRNTGPSLSPFNAWVLSKSLETLEARLEKHVSNALFIAKEIENNNKIAWLKYPFLKSHPQYNIAIKQMKSGGGIICFELKGGIESGRKFMNNLKLLSLTPNLGDSRSIASHPASTTHSKLTEQERLNVNITPGLIRLSIGLEHSQDILNDILQALEKC